MGLLLRMLAAAGSELGRLNSIASKNTGITRAGRCLCCLQPFQAGCSRSHACARSVGLLVRTLKLQHLVVIASTLVALLCGEKLSQVLVALSAVCPYDCLALVCEACDALAILCVIL